MRRPSLPNPLLVALVLVLSCTDSTTDPTSKQMVPGGGQYLYSTSGTLADEIDALSVALFPTGLETAAGTRWANIKSKVAAGDLVNAKSKLVELSRWILQKQSQMDLPGHGDTKSGAAARLVLYMSMYVYSNGTATTPTQFGGGADATVAVVTPTEPALVQTPTLRAAVAMESGTVTENTIIVVRENTTPFPRHCSGPLTTKYCQYPLFYHYESFPHVRFQKQVRVAMCHVATGTGSYGPLPGSNHNEFVVIHNKPASAADYTPGGYPVPGEDVEVLPKNPILPAVPIVACSGTTYSPSTIALLTAPHGSTGALGTALAVAARAVNRAATSIGRLLTPKDAYAVDVGEEHNTLFFSDFANADTLAHPDLAVSAASASVSSVEPGGGVTLSYTLSNVGTAHSPTVSTVYELTPTAPTTGPAITLTSSSTPGVGPLYPTESVTESAVLTVPSTVSPGTYTVGATVSSAGGLSEVTLGNNTGTVAITVRAPVAATAVSSTLGLVASSGANGIIVDRNDGMSQGATINPLHAAVDALAENAGTSVRTSGSADATWTDAANGRVVFTGMGWTATGPAGSSNNLAYLYSGTDWLYTFTANVTGSFSLQYAITLDAGGTSDFGLQGFAFTFGETGVATTSEFLSLPTASGALSRNVVAGRTYTVRLKNNANISGGVVGLTGHMSATFNWSVAQPVPIT